MGNLDDVSLHVVGAKWAVKFSISPGPTSRHDHDACAAASRRLTRLRTVPDNSASLPISALSSLPTLHPPPQPSTGVTGMHRMRIGLVAAVVLLALTAGVYS